MPRAHIAAAAALAGCALALAACGGATESGGGPPPPAAEPAAPAKSASGSLGQVAELLSVDEALASTLDGPLGVEGYLVVSADGEARLCAGLAESSSPSCAGSSLVVTGLDLGALEPLAGAAEDVRYSEAPVGLLGTVEEGVLTVSDLLI